MDMTPAELSIVVEEKSRIRNDELVTLAWLSAAFNRSKKLPNLQKLLSKPRKKIDIEKAKADFEELKKTLGGMKNA